VDCNSRIALATKAANDLGQFLEGVAVYATSDPRFGGKSFLVGLGVFCDLAEQLSLTGIAEIRGMSGCRR
jgi:hypothetical protein